MVKQYQIEFDTLIKYMYLGGFDGSNIKNLIMEFNPENEKWVEIGSMKTGRYAHGVSVVSVDDYVRWCY